MAQDIFPQIVTAHVCFFKPAPGNWLAGALLGKPVASKDYIGHFGDTLRVYPWLMRSLYT